MSKIVAFALISLTFTPWASCRRRTGSPPIEKYRRDKETPVEGVVLYHSFKYDELWLVGACTWYLLVSLVSSNTVGSPAASRLVLHYYTSSRLQTWKKWDGHIIRAMCTQQHSTWKVFWLNSKTFRAIEFVQQVKSCCHRDRAVSRGVSHGPIQNRMFLCVESNSCFTLGVLSSHFRPRVIHYQNIIPKVQRGHRRTFSYRFFWNHPFVLKTSVRPIPALETSSHSIKMAESNTITVDSNNNMSSSTLVSSVCI